MNERYRLVSPLATGGMAELFLGVAKGAEGFERTVAIKRILPHLAQEPDIARMFLAEARLATLLQHQNIATVFDVAESASGLFLVMELVDGWDLGVLLRQTSKLGRRFPPHLAAHIALHVLAGLHHAYRKLHEGRPLLMAHRDVSPSNILVSREGEVKVTDFGIARLSGASFTAPGHFKGKEAYSAPEVLQGQPATALSDQFSLGLVLHELLTGAHPFSSTTESGGSVALAIVSRDVPPLPAEIPASLADIVRRMLARAPEARFPTPEALGEVLARWLSQTGEPASAQGLTAFLAALPPPPTLREKAGGTGSKSGVSPSRPSASLRPATNDPSAHSAPTRMGPLAEALARGASAGTGAPPGHGDSQAPGALDAEEDEASGLAGIEMSSSGRLLHRCVRCGSLLSAARAPCSVCAERLAPPTPGAFDTSVESPFAPQGGLLASEDGASSVDDAVPPSRGAMDGGRTDAGNTPAGALRGGGASAPQGASSPKNARGAGPAPSGTGSATASLAESIEAVPRRPSAQSVTQVRGDSLELEERAPRPESTWDEVPASAAPRRWGRRIVLLVGVAVAVGGSVWLWPHRTTVAHRLMASVDRPMPPPVLMLTSEPSGATVLIGDKSVGTTPLALDNLYPEGPVAVQVRLKGYRMWKGTFPGGEPARLEATLQR
ncbi:protein kinase [Myxococcus sp. K38C18041901]|uniref:protein kinase domain-containing protein n=1 Tax=Myxococcus guangdongensis TaxID=2906760 RepID=UPI0020A715BA|nr:protein kinase [Myxococcus guangdongensis]MCP3061041.1 protein kinase [Myxococcus guangdongensis]